MKKKILKAFVEMLVKKLVKTEKDLKVLKRNDKRLEKDYHRILEEKRIQKGKLDRALEENEWLNKRHQCLETFEKKTKCGFSVYYQYHCDESLIESYLVAQNIESEEDVKKIIDIYEKHNKDSCVYYVIGSPEIKS